MKIIIIKINFNGCAAYSRAVYFRAILVSLSLEKITELNVIERKNMYINLLNTG